MNFKAELFCSSQLDQHCAHDSLFLAGSGGACLKRRIRPGSCYACTAAQVPQSSREVSISPSCHSFPFVLAGPCRDASVMNEQKRVRFFCNQREQTLNGETSENCPLVQVTCFTLFLALQHSEKVGVLVSMVLFSRCYCVFLFSIYSENSEQGAQRRARVSVSFNALTAVQVPETRMLGSSWMQHADAST